MHWAPPARGPARRGGTREHAGVAAARQPPLPRHSRRGPAHLAHWRPTVESSRAPMSVPGRPPRPGPGPPRARRASPGPAHGSNSTAGPCHAPACQSDQCSALSVRPGKLERHLRLPTRRTRTPRSQLLNRDRDLQVHLKASRPLTGKPGLPGCGQWQVTLQCSAL
jgi:hypothetical protein